MFSGAAETVESALGPDPAEPPANGNFIRGNASMSEAADMRRSTVARVIQRYATDLDRLADLDRGSLTLDHATPSTVTVDAADVDCIVSELRRRYPKDARLGIERDGSVRGILAQIEQTFMKIPLYGSAEEKAANLLYMVVKDHPFYDGNKRTAAALFAYYLHRNSIDLGRTLPGNMLTALILIAAASDPSKKDETVLLLQSLLMPSPAF